MTDWAALRTSYEQGVSVFNLAVEHGVTARVIQARARDEAWAVPPSVGERVRAALNPTADAAVEAAVAVKHRHRADAERLRNLAMKQFESLERIASGDVTRVKEGDMSVLSSGRGGNIQGTIAATRELTDAMSKIQTLERQAFDLDDRDVVPSPDQLRATIEAVKAELSRRSGNR